MRPAAPLSGACERRWIANPRASISTPRIASASASAPVAGSPEPELDEPLEVEPLSVEPVSVEPARRVGAAAAGAAAAARRLDHDRAGHVRVRRADVREGAGLVEGLRAAAAGREDAGVEAAVRGRGRVRGRALVGPGDGVALLDRDLGGRELEVGDRDVLRGRGNRGRLLPLARFCAWATGSAGVAAGASSGAGAGCGGSGRRLGRRGLCRRGGGLRGRRRGCGLRGSLLDRGGLGRRRLGRNGLAQGCVVPAGASSCAPSGPGTISAATRTYSAASTSQCLMDGGP